MLTGKLFYIGFRPWVAVAAPSGEIIRRAYNLRPNKRTCQIRLNNKLETINFIF